MKEQDGHGSRMGIREKTEEKVFAYMERHHMIMDGDRIAAGVSGGADSLCLFYLLLEYARKVPFRLGAVHVNHGIRPDAAEDARYVETLCRQQGIPFFLTEADVPRLVKEEKCSWEDAGRRVRYEAFSAAAESMGGGKIAVAHNSNDNAETMLFHLFRGSGLKGLCGIRPVRNRIIRPILCLERNEVEAYLRERGIVWRQDSTNEEDDYRRNRIRHHILPYAEKEIVSGAVGHMNRTAEMLEEAEDYLEKQTAEALTQCTAEAGPAAEEESEESRVLNTEAFRDFHPVLQKRMLHGLLKELSPTGKDIHQVHISDTLSLFEQEGNRCITLPFGITAQRQYNIVIIRRGGSTETGREGEPWQERPVEVRLTDIRPSDMPPEAFFGKEGAEYKIPADSGNSLVYDLGNVGKIEFTLFSKQNREKNRMKIPENQYTKWFDCDRIEESIVIRSRRTGDYLTIVQGGGGMVRKSLKAYMVTEKIPRQRREEIPVLTAGSHVLWLVGWRISEYFKVREDTKRILQVRLLGRENQECRQP